MVSNKASLLLCLCYERSKLGQKTANFVVSQPAESAADGLCGPSRDVLSKTIY